MAIAEPGTSTAGAVDLIAPLAAARFDPVRLDAFAVEMGRVASGFSGRGAGGDLDRVRAEVLRWALTLLPTADGAGMFSGTPDGRFSATSATGSPAAHLDHAQAVLEEGPAVTAITAATSSTADADRGDTPSLSMLSIADMTDSDDGGRWPRFAREARRHRAGSMLSVRLPAHLGRREVVVLNLYAESAGAFDPTARLAATLLAAQAAVALRSAHQVAEVEQGLASRDVIGQAKGILMERHRITADQAFAMLTEASQHSNVRLRDAATRLVEDTVPVPTPRPGPPP